MTPRGLLLTLAALSGLELAARVHYLLWRGDPTARDVAIAVTLAGLLLAVVLRAERLAMLARGRGAGLLLGGLALAGGVPIVLGGPLAGAGTSLVPLAAFVPWARGWVPPWRLAWRVVLLGGAAMRAAWILTAPPMCLPDSESYLVGVEGLLAGEGLRFDPSRTPLFPLLTLAGLSVGSYPAVVGLQHALGLGVAAWAGRAVGRTRGPAAGLLVLTALAWSPRLVFFEHALLSEAAFVAALTVAAVLALDLGADAGPGRAAALGGACAATVLARPVGQPFVALVLLAALLRRWAPRRLAALAACALAPLVAWATMNAVVHGAFGVSGFASMNLFACVSQLLDPAAPEADDVLARIKAEMRPALERHAARRPAWDPDINFVMYDPAGPIAASPTLAGLAPLAREKALGALCREAIARRPGMVVLRALNQLRIYALDARDHLPESWDELDGRCAGLRQKDTPLRQRLVGAPPPLHTPTAWQALVGLPFFALSLLPFAMFEHVAWLAVLLLAARRPGRDRAPLLVLGLGGMALVLLTCSLNVAIERYRVQLVPLVAVGLAVLVGRVTPRT